MGQPVRSGGVTVHNFQKSLARSEAFANAKWWGEVYRAAFPNLASMTYVAKDGWAQRGGIDRVLTLKSGKSVWIDEKVREEVWPDILLERWSDRDKANPGWIQKPLATDFIAYAYIPSRVCHLLPFPTLQRAWRINGRDWLEAAHARRDGFRVVLAQNEGGRTTESVAVPKAILFAALTDAMTVTWAEAGE